MPKYTLLVLPTAKPLSIGVYDNKGELIDSFYSEERVSKILSSLIYDVLKRYDIERMIYTSGPGSNMSVKLCYIVLESVRLVKNIPLYACSLFDINGNRPVKAMGQLYFMKEKETIITKKLTQQVDTTPVLPDTIASLAIDAVALPDYRVPAV